MKKILPIIIIFLGIGIAVGIFLFVKSKSSIDEVPDTEDTIPVIAIEKRPVLSLRPSEDGHWLKLKIEKISIDAATMDYELTYKVLDGRTQGVPGTVKLTTKADIEKDLLLGSESSGKYRYDEGVDQGKIVLRFRDTQGKLLAKFETEFTFQSNVDQITTLSGNYKFDKLGKGVFYVTMDSVGFPGEFSGKVEKAFGIFSSSTEGNSGTFGLDNIHFFNGEKWIELNENKSSDIGFFILSS